MPEEERERFRKIADEINVEFKAKSLLINKELMEMSCLSQNKSENK